MDLDKEEKKLIAKANNLIVELMHFNDNIDDSLWCSAFFAIYTHISRANGLSFEEYKNGTMQAMEYYKKLFEEE